MQASGIWSLADTRITPKPETPQSKRPAIARPPACHQGSEESGETIEPALGKSIVIIENPANGEHGPLWVRGGIPVISADGKPYTVRNRLTLCRCGKSANKPFCDGSHVSR